MWSVSLILILIDNTVPAVSSPETTTTTDSEAAVNVGAIAGGVVGGVVGGVFGVIVIIAVIVIIILGTILCITMRKKRYDLQNTNGAERYLHYNNIMQCFSNFRGIATARHHGLHVGE